MIAKVQNGEKIIIADVTPTPDWDAKPGEPGYIDNKPSLGSGSVDNLSGQNNPPNFGQTAKNGTATTAARSDHEHALPTIPTMPQPGNVGGAIINAAQTASNGSLTSFARSDHRHSQVAIPTSANINNGLQQFGQSINNGVETTYARSDHHHALPGLADPENWVSISSAPIGNVANIYKIGNICMLTYNGPVTIAGTPIPVGFRPPVNLNFQGIVIENNGASVASSITIHTTGAITSATATGITRFFSAKWVV